MDINLNDTVKVKLTDQGHAILVQAERERCLQYHHAQHAYVTPEIDKDGYATFQLHNLIHIFGPYTHMVARMPFEDNIIRIVTDA